MEEVKVLRHGTDLISANPQLTAMVDERPVEPLPQDCCGQSCQPCVFDLLHDDLLDWTKRLLEADHIHQGPNCRHLSFPMELISRDYVTPDVIRFRFALPASAQLSIQPGQHLVASVAASNGRLLSRPFTPINSGGDDHLDFLIKIYPLGRMSQLASKWQPGKEVFWRGPFGEVQWRRREVAQWVLICGGIGLAAMIPLARAILEENCWTRVRLIQSCRHNSDWFQWWSDADEIWSSGRLSLAVYLSGENCRADQVVGEVHFGRITAETIRLELNQLGYSHSGSDGPKFRFLVCGSHVFNKDLINFLRKADVGSDEMFRL